MRERFKGTGSLNTSNNNEIKERVKSGGLSEEKRNVLDMWHAEDIDDSDKETLYEKYNITKDDIRAYENKETGIPESRLADDDVIRELRERRGLGNQSETDGILSGRENILGNRAEPSGRNQLNDSLAGVAAGGVMSGISSLGGRMKSTGGVLSGAGQMSPAVSQELVQYHVKEMDILLGGEKTDPKDVSMNIQKKIGQHDEMNLEFNIKTEEIDKYVNLICSKDTPIEISLNRVSKETGEEDFKRIFNGVIENGEVIRTKGEYSKVSLTAYSRTILMDREKHYRVFQDETMTRKQVLETIMKDHTEQNKIEAYYDKRLEQPLGRIYIQFGMTDWEFLNYMLSTFEETGMGVTAHLNTIIFGFINVTQYSTNIDNATFTKKRDGKNLSYRVIGTDVFNPGEIISLVMPYEDEYEPRRVYSAKYWIKEELVNCDFESINEKEYIFPLLGNDTIKGMAVEAKVVEVGGVNGIATLTVDFTHGLSRMVDRDSRAYEDESIGVWQIPYTSMYSQSNSGFFVAPETNDIISIYFPSRNETLGYVQGAVNNPGNERASNPNVRNYTLGGDDKAGGAPLFNFQLSSNSFNVSTTDHVGLSSKETINMNTKNSILSAKNHTETVSNGKTVIAKTITQNSTVSTSINSNGNTIVSSSRVSTISGGSNVLING